MKYKVFYLFVLIGFIAVAQTPQLWFQKGNEAYKEGRYKEALDDYQKVTELGYASPELYFNMGNACYKQNQVAPAIYYFEKALTLKPDYEDAKVNLKIVRRMTLDRFEELPMTFFQRMADSIIYSISSNYWAMLSAFFALLTSVFFLGYYFSNIALKKKVRLFISLMGLFLFIITTFFAAKAYDHETSYKPAIIFVQKTGVHPEPSPASSTLYDIHEGTKVLVEEHDNNWCKIRLPNGNTGWVPCESFREIY